MRVTCIVSRSRQLARAVFRASAHERQSAQAQYSNYSLSSRPPPFRARFNYAHASAENIRRTGRLRMRIIKTRTERGPGPRPTTSGGMGTTATVVYKRLASLIAEKHDTSYHRTIHWLRCRMSFSLLRSAIMYLRGSRSTINHPARPSITGDNIDLACSEGQVPE